MGNPVLARRGANFPRELGRGTRFACVAAAVLAAAGAAFAQTAFGPPGLPDPPVVFREGLTAGALTRAYPADAWRLQQEGRVILCCLVTQDDSLACAAVAESPEAYGFGDAARTLSTRLRLTRESGEQWRARGGIIRLPIAFRAVSEPIAAPPIDAAPQCGTPASSGR